MNTPVFYGLEKSFRRKLKHTARFYPVDLHCHSPLSPCFGKKDGICQDDIDATAEPESLSTLTLGEWGWRTYGEWGAALGDSLSGITPGNLYVLRAKARNGE